MIRFALFCFSASVLYSLSILGVALIVISLLWCLRKKRPHDSTNDHIRQYLDTYLGMRKPGFAVFITGPWGCGKTHFIKHYSKRCWKFIDTHCYVSLFGVENKKDFEFRIWKGILFSNWLVVFRIFIWSFILCVPFLILLWWIGFPDKDNIAVWSFVFPLLLGFCVIIWQFAKYKARDWMLSGRYLILDDFERVAMKPVDVLSYINEMVEHNKFPVIIIGNEEEILKTPKPVKTEETSTGEVQAKAEETSTQEDNSDADDFSRTQEKVIGKRFEFNPNDELVVSALLGQLRASPLKTIISENREWFIASLLTPLHCKKDLSTNYASLLTPLHCKKDLSTNYRVLQHCFREFEYYFHNDKLNPYVRNEKIWKELIPRFFSLKYCLQISDMGFSKKFDKDYARRVVRENSFLKDKNTKEIRELYPCWESYPQFLPTEIWELIIDDHPVLPDALVKWMNAYLHPQLSLSSRWNQAFKMDDSDYEKLLADTQKAINAHGIHNPEEIIQIVAYALQIADCNEVNVGFSPKEAERKAMQYITEEKDNEQFKELQRELDTAYKRENVIRTVSFQGKSQKRYSKVKKYLLDAMETASLKAKDALFEILLKNLFSSEEEFRNWFYAENNHGRDLYSGQSPQRLLDTLDQLDTPNFVDRLESLRGHIQYGISQISRTELEFWRKFHTLAKEKINAWNAEGVNIWKTDRLHGFCGITKATLDEHEAGLQQREKQLQQINAGTQED